MNSQVATTRGCYFGAVPILTEYARFTGRIAAPDSGFFGLAVVGHKRANLRFAAMVINWVFKALIAAGGIRHFFFGEINTFGKKPFTDFFTFFGFVDPYLPYEQVVETVFFPTLYVTFTEPVTIPTYAVKSFGIRFPSFEISNADPSLNVALPFFPEMVWVSDVDVLAPGASPSTVFVVGTVVVVTDVGTVVDVVDPIDPVDPVGTVVVVVLTGA